MSSRGISYLDLRHSFLGTIADHRSYYTMSSIKGRHVSRRGTTRNLISQHDFLYCDSQAAWKMIGTCLIAFLGLFVLALKLPSTNSRTLFFVTAFIIPVLIFLFQRQRIPKQLTADIEDNAISLSFDNQLVTNFNLSDILCYKVYNHPFSQYNFWLLRAKGTSIIGTGLLIRFKNDYKPLRLYASTMYCNPAGLNRFCKAFEKKVVQYNRNAEIEIKRKRSIMAHPFSGWVMYGITTLISMKVFGDLVINKEIPKSFYGAIASLTGLWVWRNESVKNEIRYRKTIVRVFRSRPK